MAPAPWNSTFESVLRSLPGLGKDAGQVAALSAAIQPAWDEPRFSATGSRTNIANPWALP